MMACYLVQRRHVRIVRLKRLEAMVIITLLFFYCAINHYAESSDFFTLFNVLRLFTVLAIFQLDDSDLKGILGYCINIMAIISILSVLVFFIHVFHIPIKHTYIKPSANGEIYQYYYNYFGFLVMSEDQSKLRLCGIFNEPGVVGTINALLLAGDNYRLKRKWYNISLLIAGLLSLSAAFYLLSLSFLLLKLFTGKLDLTRKLQVVASCSFMILLNNIAAQKSYLYKRMIYDKIYRLLTTGQSNRVNEALNYTLRMMSEKVSLFMFGYGYGYSRVHFGTSVIKRVFVDVGFIGFVLYLLMMVMVYISFRENSEVRCDETVAFFIIFLVSLYQRPYVFEFFIIFILASSVRKIVIQQSEFIWGEK